MTIEMQHAAMRQAKADVAAASQRLADGVRRADTRVSGFLGTGWQGRAADAFTEAWTDWQDGADRVKRGLDAMELLLDAVHRDMTNQDAASQAALDGISARIVDRLG